MFARLAADATLTSGLAEFVEINSQLRGPITQLNPLQVLGQNLTVDADTVLLGLPGMGIGGLSLGNIVEVSGQIDANNSLIATRLGLKGVTPSWRLTGFVTATNTNTLHIGNQVLNVNVTPLNCELGIAVGSYVEIRATAPTTYITGTPITANQVRCSTAAQAPGSQVSGTMNNPSFELLQRVGFED